MIFRFITYLYRSQVLLGNALPKASLCLMEKCGLGQKTKQSFSNMVFPSKTWEPYNNIKSKKLTEVPMNFDDTGFEVIENLVAPEEVQKLLATLIQLKLEPLRGGIRSIEQRVPDVATLAKSSLLLSVAECHLSGRPELVRAIYFDKSLHNNWFVTWHQDRTVAVSQRFEAVGWRCWSLKSKVWHVQPPLEVLQNMVTLRVHLDAATRSNGCLKIIPHSHRIGLLASDQVQEHIDKEQVVYCETRAGGAVIMRPHILHSSEKLATSLPRRVLHFEYSSYQLPEGITWSA